MELWKVLLQPVRPLGCANNDFYYKTISKQRPLQQTAECFPSGFGWRIRKVENVLSQSLVASISLPASPASSDPRVSGWLNRHILLPQNNNHPVKRKPWATLQI